MTRFRVQNWIAVGVLCSVSVASASGDGGNWPMFRGAGSSGIQEGHELPTRWNVPRGEGLAWKTEIPGLGLASPVIWGDKLFVVTAVSEGDNNLRVGLYGEIAPVEDDSVHQWLVYCLDKNDGKILWQRKLHQGVPIIKRHTKASHANSTPATDGKRLVVMLGSEGLYCLDLDGELLWQKDLGVLDSGYFAVPDAQWGFASSPLIHEDRVIMQCDVNGDSFLAAFSLDDGRELWRTPRDEVPTWSTPAVRAHGGRTQVICNGWREIAGYDPSDGRRLWNLRGGGDIPVPTPVFSDEMTFITNAHGSLSPIYAISLEARGDISLSGDASTNEFIKWSYPRRGNYMQTPLVYGEVIYFCNDMGILSAYVAATGEVLYRERIGDGASGFTASPVGGDNKVFFTSEVGEVHVFQHGREKNRLTVNEIGEVCMATPAISNGRLYFRTQKHVMAIE